MIVKDELAFRFVDGEGFNEFVHELQPKFVIPSRWTISRDIFKLYMSEKLKLRDFFKKSGVTVSITTYSWTSVQKINYMCITAHYIDSQWTLHKKILNFYVVDSHKGEEMGRQIDDCLREWGIARVFAVAVDNITANDVTVNYLKGKLTARGCDVVKGEYLHMRCTAHVMNLIVGDGLKVINLSVKRVRDAVRFVRHSPARLARFKQCCLEEHIETKSLLCLDVATRWNSTYLMLSVALKFEKAFERFDSLDPHFRNDLKDGVPTFDDWEVVKNVVDVLVVFYDLTIRISASLHVTAHLVHHEIDTVGNLLKEWMENPNSHIKEMAVKMSLKFNKYWGDPAKVSKIYYLAVVVDPRHKFVFMEYFLKEEYGDDYGLKLAGDLRGVLDTLYEHYRILHQPQTTQSSDVSQQPEPQPLKKAKYGRSDKFMRQLVEIGVSGLKNDLDIYLGENVLTNENEDFDILKWWDTQQCRLPILAHLARDVLAVPITTVPSESAFSTGGRVLDPFRSSLTPKIVEALICGQDWLKRCKQSTSIEEHFESLKLHDEGCQ